MNKTTVILLCVLGLMTVILLGGAVLGTNLVLKTSNPTFTSDPAFYKSLGNELVSRGDIPAAIAAYEKSLTLGEDADVRNNLAVLYYQEGWYTNAINHLRVLISQDPSTVGLHYDLAVNLVDRFRNTDDKRLEDLYEALAEYKTAEELSPGFMNAANNIAALEQVLAEASG